MCLSTTPSARAHPHAPGAGPAHTLSPAQRQRIAVQALAGTVPITDRADQHDVRRRFVYRQQALADRALANAFDPLPADDAVLFHLPVTKHWLHPFTLALVLIGHGPLRGVVEICRDVLDYDLSLGTVHNLVQKAVAPARALNARENLGPVRIGAHDEIVQNGRPVLVGVDTRSTSCYLLRLEDHRDADTWAVRVLELRDRGLAPTAIVADAGRGLRAGRTAALPAVPCRRDVFHALQDVHAVVSLLEHRADRAMAAADRLRQKVAGRVRRNQPVDPRVSHRLSQADREDARAIEQADQVALWPTGSATTSLVWQAHRIPSAWPGTTSSAPNATPGPPPPQLTWANGSATSAANGTTSWRLRPNALPPSWRWPNHANTTHRSSGSCSGSARSRSRIGADGLGTPPCEVGSGRTTTHWPKPWKRSANGRSGPVRWPRTGIADAAGTSSCVVIWATTTWLGSSSSSITAGSHAANTTSGWIKARSRSSPERPSRIGSNRSALPDSSGRRPTGQGGSQPTFARRTATGPRRGLGATRKAAFLNHAQILLRLRG
ncbi:hypothetical protein FRUB_03945 [Fimbriiglobus ruber]|uniref:Uncharacterized protein n=1 Tax=Fimbriiglobus ruber TaxID=1908690 RepID=A0A225E0I3_9BACT|nr:hypothetical protein FRUB_03945 [Fimbriiglobus ruber]